MINEKIIKDSKNQDFFDCKYIKEENIILGTWTGNMLEVGPAKQAANTFIQLLESTPCDLVLDDNRLGIGPWADLNDWLMQVWLPAIAKTKIRRYAHVMSPDKSAKGPAFKMFNQVVNNSIFATFDSYKSAMTWLKDD
jgi:hypothetical protein